MAEFVEKNSSFEVCTVRGTGKFLTRIVTCPEVISDLPESRQVLQNSIKPLSATIL